MGVGVAGAPESAFLSLQDWQVAVASQLHSSIISIVALPLQRMRTMSLPTRLMGRPQRLSTSSPGAELRGWLRRQRAKKSSRQDSASTMMMTTTMLMRMAVTMPSASQPTATASVAMAMGLDREGSSCCRAATSPARKVRGPCRHGCP